MPREGGLRMICLGMIAQRTTSVQGSSLESQRDPHTVCRAAGSRRLARPASDRDSVLSDETLLSSGGSSTIGKVQVSGIASCADVGSRQ